LFLKIPQKFFVQIILLNFSDAKPYSQKSLKPTPPWVKPAELQLWAFIIDPAAFMEKHGMNRDSRAGEREGSEDSGVFFVTVDQSIVRVPVL
jgi:hypothetical protein